MIKILNSKFIIILIISFVLFPAITFAAKLYLEPADGEYRQGDTFIVSIKIDPEGECVNAIEANIDFPQDILDFKDFSKGDSIISFWIKNEAASGLVSFAGGIPAGYCGRLSGDPDESNLLGKIIFQVKEIGGNPTSAQIQIRFLDTSQVLLNDGMGTPARLTTKGSAIDIKPFSAAQGRNEWQDELAKDTIPPEPFGIEISSDPSIFNGKYFITFQTTDKQTGIDYYEVKEGDKGWKKTGSPYRLEDQRLGSIIKVGAVDKAGNERIIEYRPALRTKQFPYWIIATISIIGVVIIWRIIKKFKNEKP